ncbi:MAG: hypothetical protein AVDCRST_MAG91-2905, partial [uncultured Sphingomonadaceae bacterium]
ALRVNLPRVSRPFRSARRPRRVRDRPSSRGGAGTIYNSVLSL